MLTFPLDNVQYEANALGAWLGTRNRGVFSTGTNFAVSLVTGMQISVASGIAWLKKDDSEGTICFEENAKTFTIAAANAQHPRLDIVCIQLNKLTKQATVVVKQGVAEATPAIVPPVRDDDYDEIYLASIFIPAGATALTADNITDLRLNKNYCGLVRDGVTMIPVEELESQIQELVAEIRAELQQQEGGSVNVLEQIYPVGSIYMSMSATSPATIFGGTWTQLQNRFLIGAGSSYAVGAEGGATSHAHGTNAHALTISEIPSHSHTFGYSNWSMYDASNSGDAEYSNVAGYAYTKTTNTVGGGAAHTHGNTTTATTMPPYKAVYMWYRTA